MNIPGSNNNGLLLKIIIGVLTTGLVGTGAGMIRLYGQVQVLMADTQLSRRIEVIEVLARDIAVDRDKRTIIIQGFKDANVAFKDDIVELKHRLDILERRLR